MKKSTLHLFFALTLLAPFQLVNAECGSADLSWLFDGFEQQGLERQTIKQCVSSIAKGVYNFEGELAYYGICVAELSNKRANGRKLVENYNRLMKQCGHPQLFIAKASNPFSHDGLKESCYLHVMNNWPSASIPASCLAD